MIFPFLFLFLEQRCTSRWQGREDLLEYLCDLVCCILIACQSSLHWCILGSTAGTERWYRLYSVPNRFSNSASSMRIITAPVMTAKAVRLRSEERRVGKQLSSRRDQSY